MHIGSALTAWCPSYIAIAASVAIVTLLASLPFLITLFYRMISIVYIKFVNKLNFDVFIKNVISLGLFGSYGNIQLYNLWNRAQR